MSPFLPEYSEQMNLSICTGVTVLALDSGEVVIMEFGQGFWFVNRRERLLINQNQCRKFGIKICDDPAGPHRKMVIEAS